MSLDRAIGNRLQGKKALILVDIEGAEYQLLQGAKKTLINEPHPIWMMEISSTEHQPEGITINPYFEMTFEQFFSNGYRAQTAENLPREITPETVNQIMHGNSAPPIVNNYVFTHKKADF
jgi:hypothetical protein